MQCQPLHYINASKHTLHHAYNHCIERLLQPSTERNATVMDPDLISTKNELVQEARALSGMLRDSPTSTSDRSEAHTRPLWGFSHVRPTSSTGIGAAISGQGLIGYAVDGDDMRPLNAFMVPRNPSPSRARESPLRSRQSPLPTPSTKTPTSPSLATSPETSLSPKRRERRGGWQGGKYNAIAAAIAAGVSGDGEASVSTGDLEDAILRWRRRESKQTLVPYPRSPLLPHVRADENRSDELCGVREVPVGPATSVNEQLRKGSEKDINEGIPTLLECCDFCQAIPGLTMLAARTCLNYVVVLCLPQCTEC